MDPVFNPFAFESGIMLVAALALFALKAFAFLDALSRPEKVFPAADRQT